jgi:benzoate membrane transport protein
MLALVALALLGALTGALATAMAAPEQRLPAVLTLAVTAAGVPFLGIGAPFWGLVAGLALFGLDRAARRG